MQSACRCLLLTFVSNVRLFAYSVCLSPSLPPMLSCGKCASSLCTTLSGDFHFMFTAQMRVCVCATIAIHSCFIHAGGSSTNFKFCIYLLSAVNALAFDARVSHWFATSIRTLWQATLTKVSMLPTNPASARYRRSGIVRRDQGSGWLLVRRLKAYGLLMKMEVFKSVLCHGRRRGRA